MGSNVSYNEEWLPEFDCPVTERSIIKVVGVGGGGGNAVDHMYRQGIKNVNFVVCNTDDQDLRSSCVPVKLQLGPKITSGLGAGNNPAEAKAAAEESWDDIAALFQDGTQMAFITAGMGGGTGTGAAPVVARVAKEQNILTVGIVTIPFLFEGEGKIKKALQGAEEMRKYVDALLIINNERLREIYPDLNIMNAFAKADDILSIAAQSIAEIISVHGHINLDFADVKRTLKDGGAAVISTGYGTGDPANNAKGRVTEAIHDALNSPLLRNNNAFEAKRVLIYLHFSPKSENPVRMEEMGEINDYMLNFPHASDVIWGAAYDESLGDRVKITFLATGFSTGASDAEYSTEIRADRELMKARKRYIVLTPDTICDDALAEMMENYPPYLREDKMSHSEPESESQPL